MVKGMNNIGGLFQYLNSEACLPYYASLDASTWGSNVSYRAEILDQIMSDPVFLEAAQALVSDTAIIQQKLETKVGQLCKKMAEKMVAAAAKPAVVVKPKEAPIVYVEVEEVEYPEFDEERGKHLGGGFYLKREDHLMKLTSPEWTIYY